MTALPARLVPALVALILVGLCAAPSHAAKNVSVRGWAHSEFGRLVFEWDKPVKHSARIAGRTLTVQFGSPVTESLTEVSKGLSAYVRSVRLSKNRRTLTATLRGPFKLRKFAKRNIVIVDLVKASKTSSTRRSPSSAAPALPVRTGQHKRYGRLVFDWKTPVDYTARKSKGKVVIRFRQPARIDTDRLRRRLPNQVAGLTSQSTGRGLELRLDVARASRVRHFRDGTRVVVDVIGRAAPKSASTSANRQPAKKPESSRIRTASAPSKPNTSKQEKSKPQSAASTAAAAKVTKKKTGKPKDAQPKTFVQLVSVDAEKQPNGISLAFNWREDTSVAAYRRGGSLWLFFDKPARLDLGAIRVIGRTVITEAKQIKAPGTAWLKLDVPRRIGATLSRKDQAWVLQLSGAKNDPAKEPIATPVRIDRKGPHAGKVRLLTPKGLTTFEVVDPDVGDDLFITPTRDTKLALERPHRFIQFELLPSIAGLVVARKADGVDVRRKGGAIEISSPKGLIVSRAEDAKAARPSRAGRGPRQPLSHIKDWLGETGVATARAQQRLIDRIIKAPVPKRNKARLDLARFYLAQHKPAAAVGVLDIIRRQDLSYERNLDFRALRGAAKFLLGHFGNAEADLNYSFLKKDSSAAPWRAGVAAEKGDWTAAHRLFQSTEAIIADYPDWLANRFTLLAAEAALTANDLKSAKKRLDSLGTAVLPVAQRSQLDYLQAFLLKKQGKTKQAVDRWKALADSKDRRVRAKAAFSATEAELEAGEIELSAAIDRLEGLTFAWRGDAFEFDLLRRLGDLYTRDRNHRSALNSYRQAASYFENVEGAEEMTQRMSDLFDRLYLKGGADKLPAVRALALYEEFRELTPAGKAGDEMIRRLADRLARADLLEESAQLLDHQVEFRLEGPKKAEIGARLALIRLLDQKPAAAIEALDKSKVDGLATEVQMQRSHLRARALSQLGRAPQALAAIKGDDSRDAELIRVSVHWRKNAWKEASQAIDRILKDVTPAALTESDLRLVLQWSVALALAQDAGSMDAVRRRFSKAMEGSPHAEAFKAIVGRGATDIPDYKTLAKTAGDLSSFESFMSSYRQQVRAARPGAIN